MSGPCGTECAPRGAVVYRFEDLQVWQAARQQCERVGRLLKRPEFQRDRHIGDHLNASSLSVMNNISEGFLRHRDREFLQFLRIAAASNGEVRSCCYAAHDRGHLGDEELDALLHLNDSIGRMIRRLQASLRA